MDIDECFQNRMNGGHIPDVVLLKPVTSLMVKEGVYTLFIQKFVDISKITMYSWWLHVTLKCAYETCGGNGSVYLSSNKYHFMTM